MMMKLYFKELCKHIGCALAITFFLFSCKQEKQNVYWVSSTDSATWVEKEPVLSNGENIDVTVSLQTKDLEQKVDGFGGCFNELGWDALNMVTPTEKQQILNDLFDPENGCKFDLCRMPIGANDYAVDWYSHNETDKDFAMDNFSIARDRQRLVPYIQAAQKITPSLRIWASPWCPPSWMKASHHYACRADEKVNDLAPELSSMEELVSRFIVEPEYLQSYALYFSKFIQAYKKEGVEIEAVHVQNEPNSAQNFPSCVWKPEDLGLFIAEYLGPQLKKDNLGTDIWMGTVERPYLDRVSAVLDYENASEYIKGVGFQWAGKGAIEAVHAKYPNMQLMQTETECGDGSNDWKAAEYTFNLMKHYFENGANSYMYWNMVLDETGKSQWGWKQNSMISIDKATKKIVYNPEFYLMKHLSAFVRPGDYKIKSTEEMKYSLGFYNPSSGATTLLCYNPESTQKNYEVAVDGKNYNFKLAARSFNTIVLEK